MSSFLNNHTCQLKQGECTYIPLNSACHFAGKNQYRAKSQAKDLPRVCAPLQPLCTGLLEDRPVDP